MIVTLIYHVRIQMKYGTTIQRRVCADLDVRKIIGGVLNDYATSLYNKVRSPPYCSAVPLDPRLGERTLLYKVL